MKIEKRFYVYILASQRNGTIYIGVTNNILSRGSQHKLRLKKSSFTAKYNVYKLVHYEVYDNINDAINRDKQ